MPHFSPVFAQVMSLLHPQAFQRCVEQHPFKRKPRGLSAYDHFLALCFAQLTYRESLRDIEACLNARAGLTYPLGFRGHITRTNLAYANEHRDWRLFAEVAQVLMRRAQRLYQTEPVDADWPALTFALDSTLIHLSAQLFPWAVGGGPRRPTAVKLHVLLNLRGHHPAWAAMSRVQVPDLKMLDVLPVEPGGCYILDRGYVDYSRLYAITTQQAWFVVRSRKRISSYVAGSQPVDKTTGLRSDQIIRLNHRRHKAHYPEPLRRIRLYDDQQHRSLVFLTNNFHLPAATIAQLYKQRWQVELFFKWIKQHLRLRAFLGKTPNAVQCQLWSAICSYLLVAILKKELKLHHSLHEILQILSIHPFEQTPITELITRNTPETTPAQNQKLFEFNHL